MSEMEIALVLAKRINVSRDTREVDNLTTKGRFIHDANSVLRYTFRWPIVSDQAIPHFPDNSLPWQVLREGSGWRETLRTILSIAHSSYSVDIANLSI
jgi:hypothetical protein